MRRKMKPLMAVLALLAAGSALGQINAPAVNSPEANELAEKQAKRLSDQQQKSAQVFAEAHAWVKKKAPSPEVRDALLALLSPHEEDMALQLRLGQATPAQETKIKAIRANYATKLTALQKQIDDLEAKQRTDIYKVLDAK